MFFVMSSGAAADAGPGLVPIILIGPSTTGSRSIDGGTNWSNITYPSGALVSAAYGASRFVAIGNGTATAISTDAGATWSAGGAMTASKSWWKIGFSPTLGSGMGRFVAMNNNATDTVGNYSDDGGASWTAFSLPATVGSGRGSILWDGSTFFTIINGSAYMSSTGISGWNTAGSAIGASVNEGVYDFINERFIYGRTGGPVAAYITSATAALGGPWTNSSTSISGNWSYISTNYDGSIISITQSGADNRAAASTDGGVTFSTATTLTTANWPSEFSGEAFVAAAGLTSEKAVDGYNFAPAGAPAAIVWTDMIAAREALLVPV